MYRAKDSVYKQLVRNYLFSAVKGHVEKKNYMSFATLSNTCFSLEQQLLKQYPRSICVSYERDKAVFKEARRTAPKGVLMVNGDIFHIWKGNDYSFVWLDFCNSYTDDFMTQIANLVAEIPFADKAVLSITLARTRGKGNNGLLYNDVFKNYKDEGFATHMIQFLPNVESVTRVQYKCADVSSKAVPMNVFNFFINKTI